MGELHRPSDELFMRRAFELAMRGIGSVSPNPLVGCVVVCNDRIIGEGWHRQYGEAHAEVNAIDAVEDKSLLPESDVYVNLEPCAHHGKTPPCADLITAVGARRVVIANVDPNPLVGGKGLEKLRAYGIKTVTAILEGEGKFLNRRFFTFLAKKRPYIILKWAQTIDGFIARADGSSKWISEELSRQLVHRWRTEEDAILVGTRTAEKDNPQLNVRLWTGRDPVRIVIDRNLQLRSDLHLFDSRQMTLRYNLLEDRPGENVQHIRLSDRAFLYELLSDLHRRGIQSMIVEGGTATLQRFIDEGLWDEARIFTNEEKRFTRGIPAPRIEGNVRSTEHIGRDLLTIVDRQ